jgi:type IV secretion system protein TrbB
MTSTYTDRRIASDDRTVKLIDALLGPVVCDLLQEPDIMDVLIRPDWVAVDRATTGLSLAPEAVGTVKLVELLRLLGPLVDQEVQRDSTVVELQLPGRHARFAGLFRGAQSFCTIRRAVVRALPLQEYVQRGIFGEEALTRILESVTDPLCGLLIAGATGSGKTTFLASVLGEIILQRGIQEHLVIVEDTPEISVDGPMVTSIVATQSLSYRSALRAALRHRPTRVIVGEVRGAEALDAVKAGATGHGLMMTVHASSAEGAMRTLISRMAEGTDGHIDPQLIPEAIKTVAVFQRTSEGPRLSELGILHSASPLNIERVPIS